MQDFWTMFTELIDRVLVMASNRAPVIFLALIIFIVGLWLAAIAKGLVRRALQFRRGDPEFSLLMGRVVQWTVAFFALLFATQQIGVDITAFLAGLGILGFTLGFALQDISKNFISGILMLLQKPFSLGDTIEVSGFNGTVLNITLRDTLMLTADGLRVRIPNGDILTKPILNFSKLLRRRIQITFGVGYTSDLEQVRSLIRETIGAIAGLVADPQPEIVFEAFTEYSIRVRVAYWYDEKQTNYPKALDAGISGLKAAFDKAGIEMPVPYRELRIDGEMMRFSAQNGSAGNPQRDPGANAAPK
jgi:small conductance mechanosensitive channel